MKFKKLNNFVKICRSSEWNVHRIESEESGTDMPSQCFIESIQSNVEKCNKPLAKMYLKKEGINVEIKINTGAEANIIPT